MSSIVGTRSEYPSAWSSGEPSTAMSTVPPAGGCSEGYLPRSDAGAGTSRASSARDEALLADLKAEAPGALPRAWRPRADAWRALLRGTLRDPTWAPSHLYKEAEQRALLAALIHPPGACPGPFGGHDLAERAHDPTRRPRPLQRRAQAIVEKGAYEDFVRRSGSYGDDDRSFRVEKRGARRVQLYSRRLAFECCTNSLCGALFKAQAEDVRETRLDRLHLPEGAVPLPAVVREIAPLLGPPRSYNFDEAAARAAFEDADRRYSALKGIEKRLEDELARLRVEEAALRAAAGEVDEEGWAQFDPARDGSENLEAV